MQTIGRIRDFTSPGVYLDFLDRNEAFAPRIQRYLGAPSHELVVMPDLSHKQVPFGVIGSIPTSASILSTLKPTKMKQGFRVRLDYFQQISEVLEFFERQGYNHKELT